MLLHFTKMHGLGNDFMVIDRISQEFHFRSKQIRSLADRQTGVGFDQLLVIEAPKHPDTDFFYRIYNADGTEVGQCGNGARCVARFLYEKGLTYKKNILAETISGRVKMILEEDGSVTVDMGKPKFAPKDIPFVAKQTEKTYTLTVDEKNYEVGVVSMGNPHAVTVVPQVKSAPVKKAGRLLAYSDYFPTGANVGFMEIVSSTYIRLRVFERGVGETRACGTGACAAVVVGRLLERLDDKVTVELPGGELRIQWKRQNGPVLMTGPAVTVYEGRIRL